MAPKIKEIVNSGMDIEKPLRLTKRFESAHASLPNPSRLMG